MAAAFIFNKVYVATPNTLPTHAHPIQPDHLNISGYIANYNELEDIVHPSTPDQPTDRPDHTVHYKYPTCETYSSTAEEQ